MPREGPLPRLRNVEAIPTKSDGQPIVILRDPHHIATQVLGLPLPAYIIVAFCNGVREVRDVQSEIAKRFGTIIPADDIEKVIDQLDDAFFLDTPRFHAEFKRLREDFAGAKVRVASHAGGGYPTDPTALRKRLDSFYTAERGPGAKPVPNSAPRPVLGLMAPHIDYHRGGPAYGWAYKALAEGCPEASLFVVLGIAHSGMGEIFTLTRKGFETPLGTAATDAGFVDDLAKRYGRHCFDAEYVHKGEHSIEFQVVFLQHLFKGKRKIRIVPILCGTFSETMEDGRTPEKTPEIEDFIGALGEMVRARGEEVCVVAGVDLAHQGPQFGDPDAITKEALPKIEEADRALLATVLSRDPAGFYAGVAKDNDARHICGYPAIYTLLRTIDASEAELLTYGQTLDPETQSTVTFASAAFR